jgi:hypothetical protein
MKRIAGLVVVTAACLFAVVFAGDYLSVRFGIPNHREQFDYVDVRRFYAVKLKNKKTEYTFDKPESMERVNSLLPHYGDTPCWYLKRHTVIQVNLDSGPFGALIDSP